MPRIRGTRGFRQNMQNSSNRVRSRRPGPINNGGGYDLYGNGKLPRRLIGGNQCLAPDGTFPPGGACLPACTGPPCGQQHSPKHSGGNGGGYVGPDGQLFTNIADCERLRYTGSYRHCIDSIRIREGMWH